MPTRLWNPRFMVLGNSLVTGLPGTGDGIVANMNSFRKTLWDYVVAQGLTRSRGLAFVGSQMNGIVSGGSWDSFNEGHPGYTTAMILGEIVSWLRLSSPGAIITQFGINDIGDGIEAGANARFATILDTIRAYDPLIVTFVSSMTLTDGGATMEAKRASLNSQFQATVADRVQSGQRAVFLDAGNMISLSDVVPLSSGDGIHLTEAGYANYGTALGSLLLPYIPRFIG
jgi:lysophospholipase L1-like esterase